MRPPSSADEATHASIESMESTSEVDRGKSETPARILVVDDQEAVCGALERTLTEAGYQIQTCLSGEEAITKLTEGSFDLVITGLSMSNVDGVEVLRRAKESDPFCEVIVMANHASVQSVVEVMKLGAHDCIPNTLNADEKRDAIRVAVDTALERRRRVWIDGVTELYDDRAFHNLLKAEIGRSQRQLRPLSLLMLGLDDLQARNRISDQRTNARILKDVAWLIKKSLRNCDVVAKHREDKLAIILVETGKRDAIDTGDRLRRLIEGAHFVYDDVLAGENRPLTASIGVASYPTDACQQMTLEIKAEQALHEAETLGGNVVRAAERELSLMGRYPEKRLYFLCKRWMDITLSLLLLVVSFPLLLLIALLIKLDSPGPVFFNQRRVGLRKLAVSGRKRWELGAFTMYKFRTMRLNLDDSSHRAYMRAFVNEQIGASEDGEVHKPVRSSQMTRLGRILRKTSLDELPQLLNVLKGEMSLVGPRPNLPWEVERYQPWHYKRLEVLPGITGLAQVRGRSCIGFDRIVQYDIEYIAEQSLALDLKILWWTVLFVVFGRGAY